MPTIEDVVRDFAQVTHYSYSTAPVQRGWLDKPHVSCVVFGCHAFYIEIIAFRYVFELLLEERKFVESGRPNTG